MNRTHTSIHPTSSAAVFTLSRYSGRGQGEGSSPHTMNSVLCRGGFSRRLPDSGLRTQNSGLSLALLVLLILLPSSVHAQKWVNPQFDTHRLDCRDLGYPDVTQIDADNSPISALLTAPSGKVYGATSGKSASYLFVYDRAINKVRPLGRLGDALGVHHTLVADRDGTILIGGGLNMLAPVPLTQEFPSGYRAIEEQLWKDISAPYAKYPGGHLYRYDPATGDAGVRINDEPAPLEDLGIPVPGNTIYAMALDAKARRLYGVSYPDAKFFVYDLEKKSAKIVGPAYEYKVYSGPERTWRSIPRALDIAPDGRVYTSGDDGRIVCYDPATGKLQRTTMQIPGEYWEAWNYYGAPVVEQFVRDCQGNLFGSTSDGFLFQMHADRNQIVNLGKPRVGRRIRGMAFGPDQRLYMICGEFQDVCKLYSYSQSEGFRDWGCIAVDRSPYYAKRAYQFDSMAAGIDGTLFLGESDRRASLFIFLPGGKGFEGNLNPKNPRAERQ